jgi:hypothetical protein
MFHTYVDQVRVCSTDKGSCAQLTIHPKPWIIVRNTAAWCTQFTDYYRHAVYVSAGSMEVLESKLLTNMSIYWRLFI